MPIALVRNDGVIFPHDKEQFTYCPEPEQTEELPTLPVPEKRPRLNPTNEEATVPSSLPQTSGPNFHPATYSQPSVSQPYFNYNTFLICFVNLDLI